MNYITLAMALEKHEYIIQVSGGLHGIVPDNQQHLESLLLFVQDDVYYRKRKINQCIEKAPDLCYPFFISLRL